MRHTNVCLNRVFKFYVNFTLNLFKVHANFCACEKVCDENQKKEKNNWQFIQVDQRDVSMIRNN